MQNETVTRKAKTLVKGSLRSKAARAAEQNYLIRRLKSLPFYAQIVKKLVAGESSSSVVRWAMKFEGAPKWSYRTWRNMLAALAPKIRLHLGPEGFKPAASVDALTLDATLQRLEQQMTAEALDVPLTKEGQRVWNDVKAAMVSLNAEIMLKFLFVVQQGRLEMLLDMEKKLGMPLDWGHKEIQAMVQIAAEIRKFEVGEAYMKGKMPAAAYGDPYPGGLLPQAPADSMIADRLSRLSAVDRNLIVAASSRVVDMIAEDVGDISPIGGLTASARAEKRSGAGRKFGN